MIEDFYTNVGIVYNLKNFRHPGFYNHHSYNVNANVGTSHTLTNDASQIEFSIDFHWIRSCLGFLDPYYGSVSTVSDIFYISPNISLNLDLTKSVKLNFFGQYNIVLRKNIVQRTGEMWLSTIIRESPFFA